MSLEIPRTGADDEGGFRSKDIDCRVLSNRVSMGRRVDGLDLVVLVRSGKGVGESGGDISWSN